MLGWRSDRTPRSSELHECNYIGVVRQLFSKFLSDPSDATSPAAPIFGAASSDSSKASLKGEGERLVNPRILRIASEKTTRTLYAEVPAREGTASGSVKIVETNEYIVNPD